jgi:hypothetical protein
VPSVLFYVVESTLNQLTVTAEAAGSSPVVPAIPFNKLEDSRRRVFLIFHEIFHKPRSESDMVDLLGLFFGGECGRQDRFSIECFDCLKCCRHS